jgi:type VI secretion system secreted protein VgrG
LPDHENISGIRSRSTPGGTSEHYNEIILDDTKGKERVAIHAERNFSLHTEAAEQRRIGANSETYIRGARGVMVQGEQDVTFEVVTVDGEARPYQRAVGDYLGVQGDRVVEIGRVLSQKIGEGYVTEVLEGDYLMLLQNGNHKIALAGAGNQQIDVLEGDQVIDVLEGSQKILLGKGDHVVQANGHVTLKASGALIGGYISLEADQDVMIEAKRNIMLKVGETMLVLSEQGVTIDAPFISQHALVKATMTGSIVDIVAAMQATINSAVMTSVGASGLVRVAGNGVLIN